MRLLFEDLAWKHFHNRPNRFQKLKGWVEEANKTGDKLDKKANQYYKAEELITFYTFAPLDLRSDKKDLVNEILRSAGVKETVESMNRISFEKLCQLQKATYLG